LGLILAGLLAQTAGLLALARAFYRFNHGWRLTIAWDRIQHKAVEYSQFPCLSLPASLLNSACSNLTPILLVKLYGTEVTGAYGLGLRLVSLPLGLFGTAVAQVYLGEAAEKMRTSPGEVVGLFGRITKRLLKLGALIAGLGAIAPFAFPIVFGARWAQAGVFAAVLALPAAAQIVVSPISATAVIMKRQDLQLWLDGLAAVATFSTLLVMWASGASATWAIGGYALVMTALYGVYFLVYRHLACTLAPRSANSGPGDGDGRGGSGRGAEEPAPIVSPHNRPEP
jgi:O-antigen/teichoic acid export membrane protein